MQCRQTVVEIARSNLVDAPVKSGIREVMGSLTGVSRQLWSGAKWRSPAIQGSLSYDGKGAIRPK